ncbi:hypothetical protein [Amycolatopsis thermoflava]|uniref:hypothetical protein n=1 Tax=Amycolatopsis thermoflava TaxID=84480 RepID=UPI0038279A25
MLDGPEPSQADLITEPAISGTIITIALVASAEILFSAAAVDRMHDGPPTR